MLAWIPLCRAGDRRILPNVITMSLHRFASSDPPADSLSAVERLLSPAKDTNVEFPFLVTDAVRQFVALSNAAQRCELEDWMAKLLSWLPHWQRDGSEFAQDMIEALLAVGAFGTGTSFGQRMVLPVPERAVMVPGIGAVSIGGSWVPDAAPALPRGVMRRSPGNLPAMDLKEAGAAPSMTSDAAHEIGSLVLSARSGVRLTNLSRDWQRRLVVLSCGYDPTRRMWRMPDEVAIALAEWAGVMPGGTGEEVVDLDQELVVALPEDARAIVEAGPGSGKTHVVCRRIVHLVEAGAPPSRIWLLSFTKVAVEEIRQRVATALTRPQDARSLHVATFDSFAGSLLSACMAPGAVRPAGFEASIEAAADLLAAPPPTVQGFVANLAHVVIDEAQDLLGMRQVMVRRFLALLPQTCGVTILGDAAQSIYGWNLSDALAHHSLLDPTQGYDRLVLRTDHRTSDPGLAGFFAAARDVLLTDDIPAKEKYLDIRNRIETVACGSLRSLSDPAAPTGRRAMVLFRGRKALLAESQRLLKKGQDFRLRATAQGLLIQPWIGALLAGHNLPGRIRREDLNSGADRAATVLGGFVGESGFGPLEGETLNLALDEAWNILRNLTDDTGGRIDLSQLHARLGQSLPPSLLRPHLGNSGPVLSTIHAAKGLEADQVVLVLPRSPDAESAEDNAPSGQHGRRFDFEEEARVLYVGATRAKRRLHITGQRSGSLQRLGGTGRCWRGSPGDFSVEIGLEGDVVPVAPGASAQPDLLEQAAAALTAPGSAPSHRAGIALRDAEGSGHAIYRADPSGAAEGPALGWLSQQALSCIAAIARCPLSALPARIDGFFLSGAATCCWSEADSRGIALVPVLCGLANVSMESPE